MLLGSNNLTYFCFSSNGQSASAIVSKTSGSFSRSSLYILQKLAMYCSPPLPTPPSLRTWRARTSPEKRSLWKSIAAVILEPARPMSFAQVGTDSFVASRTWPIMLSIRRFHNLVKMEVTYSVSGWRRSQLLGLGTRTSRHRRKQRLLLHR
jgi:hypothetical protein